MEQGGRGLVGVWRISQVTDTSLAIGRLFNPKSIAVIGASQTPGKRGHVIISNLQGIGFSGRIYPVNPRYDAVAGLKCFPSLSALPEVPDVVAVCLAAEFVPNIIEECGRAGIRCVAVVSAAFADSGPEGLHLQEKMLSIARQYGVSILGPNGLGILNRLDGVQYWILRPPGGEYLDRAPSGVSAIVQSGAVSMSITMDARERGLMFDYVVSAGNQASIDVADYLEWLIDHAPVSQRVIGAIIEGIGKPDKFRGVCDRALRKGIAIVLLKAGQSATAEEFVASHTGALVGSAEVLNSVLDSLGVITVSDPDEWLEHMVLFAHPHRPDRTPWCMITTSGGSNAVIGDIADRIGLEIPPASPHVTREMKRIADRPVLNPLDAGGYYDAPARYSKAVAAAVADPEVALVVACVAWYPGADEPSHELFDAALESAARGIKPIIIFSFGSGPIPDASRTRLRQAGLYPLRGCRNALLALMRLTQWIDRRAAQGQALLPSSTLAALPPGPIRNLDPAALRRQLEDCGLKIPGWRQVRTKEEAIASAHDLGMPVVLKAEHADLLHKTELGAVVLGLDNDADIARHFETLHGNVLPKLPAPGASISVQKQAGPGLEMIMALRRDRVFGLYFAIGFGGMFAELLDDVAVRPLPIDQETVKAMLKQLRGAPLLSGYRNGVSYDVPAVIEAAMRIAEFAERTELALDTLEINPLIVLPGHGGAWVADAIMSITGDGTVS